MFRRTVGLSFALTVYFTGAGFAAEWADKMFVTLNHDFGTCARGAATTFRFEFSNPFEEPVHVQSVSSSCGCTTPRIEKDTLTTFEKSAIVAQFNTDAFLGQKSATVNVTFDKPYFAQVQLRVSGYIRSDVVFNPGRLDFANVDRGVEAERIATLDYAGGSHWKLVEAKCANEHLHVEFKEKARGNGRVAYDLVAKLDADASIGDLNEQVLFVAEDGQKFPLTVTGRIVSEINITPETLFLGELAPDQSVTKKLIVRGKKPFSIKGTSGELEGMTFEFNEKTEERHLITLNYTAPSKPGLVSGQIKLKTDLGEEVLGQMQVQAQIVKSRTSAAKPVPTTVQGTAATSPLAIAN